MSSSETRAMKPPTLPDQKDNLWRDRPTLLTEGGAFPSEEEPEDVAAADTTAEERAPKIHPPSAAMATNPVNTNMAKTTARMPHHRSTVVELLAAAVAVSPNVIVLDTLGGAVRGRLKTVKTEAKWVPAKKERQGDADAVEVSVEDSAEAEAVSVVVSAAVTAEECAVDSAADVDVAALAEEDVAVVVLVADAAAVLSERAALN
jgi:hypothetical protein